MSKITKPDLAFETNLKKTESFRGIFDFDIKIGGTLGSWANHWKEEMKTWEIKDVTELFSKINIDKLSLPSEIQGYFDNLDISLKAINIDYKQFSSSSIDLFNVSVAQMVNISFNGPLPTVGMDGKIEEIFSRNLAHHFASISPEVKGGLCSTLVGAAMVLASYLIEANSDKYDQMCKYIRDSAAIVAPAACAFFGG